MKKFLLTLTACVVALTSFAQVFEADWTASFEPVSASSELKGVHTAASVDGSVYVSGTYDKSFSFGATEVADPEGLTSACIVKYNGLGEEQWAVTILGNAVVSSLDTDADGALYVAGYYMDAVEYIGTDGNGGNLSGEYDVYNTFVAKISADGKFLAVKSFAPVANADALASGLYFPFDASLYLTPSRIQVDGEKVYVSASYTGDVAELDWSASYLNVFDFMYMENKSIGLFSLNKSDLSSPESVATVQATTNFSYDQHFPEALNFVAEEGTVYVGFFGFGNLTLTTSVGASDFAFNTDYAGSNEHGFVLATVGTSTSTKKFDVAMHDGISNPYNVFMNVVGENLIIGGTFYGELPFDTSITTGELASDVFMASLDKATYTVNSVFVSGKDNSAVCMADGSLVSTAGESYILAGDEVSVVASPVYAGLDYCYDASASVICNETIVEVAGAAKIEDDLDEGWEAVFEPVSASSELKGVHTAASVDGSVYVSGTYDKSFSFGATEVADPEGLTSACIVKYNGLGEEQWAVTILGNAVVSSLDTDADGALYVAGYYMDAVEYIGTDGNGGNLSGEYDVYNTFVAKISADGKFLAVKSFAPVANADALASGLYFPFDASLYLTPSRIQVDGEKVYVSASYTGDVAELDWSASYLNVFDFMYMENKSIGLFSLNKSDLSSPESVATVQATTNFSYDQHFPEALNFVAEEGTVYVGFFGFGNLTLTTSVGASDFAFNTDYAGSNEHGFVLATVGTSTSTKKFDVAMHDGISNPYNVFMNVVGENLIIGGTFYGELPFDTSITTGELASDVFMASLDKATCTVNDVFVSGIENSAIAMTIDSSSSAAILASTSGGYYVFDFETGEVWDSESPVYSCIDSYDGINNSLVYSVDTKIYVSGFYDVPTGIEDIVYPALNENGVTYNLFGQPVDDTYKGIVIKNGKKYIVK